jgi:hypothetical protein
VDVVLVVKKCIVLTSFLRADRYTELLCPTEKRKKEKRNSWTKTGLRVRDDEVDRRSGPSMTYISPIAASAVAQHPGGDGE